MLYYPALCTGWLLLWSSYRYTRLINNMTDKKHEFRGLVYLVIFSPWKEMKHCSVPFLTKWCIKLHLEGRGRWEGGGGGVGQQSYRVALLRLGGAIYSDTIGWWCQLWHVCLDEAASVDETNERKAENIVTVSKHYTAKVTQQHNNTTHSSDRPVLL